MPTAISVIAGLAMMTMKHRVWPTISALTTIDGQLSSDNLPAVLAELLTLLFSPVAWLLRRLIGRKRATPDEIRRFYRSTEWKRLRYAHLAASPACKACGASAKDGARMNVDHIRPLHVHWHRRLDRTNLQTLCASCNLGKGGGRKDWR